MVFSDTTTRLGLIQDAEDRLNFPATGISGNAGLLQTFTRYMNTWYQKSVTMILASQDGWDFDDSANTDYPVATTLLTTSRDVTFPASLKVLKIKRVDVTYDGTNWYKCEAFDSGNTGLGLGNDTNTDARYSKQAPRYDLVGSNGIWLYPAATAADVTAGASIRVEFYRDITEFASSDTTKTPGFDNPFHSIISIGACYEYAASKPGMEQRAAAFLVLLQDYEVRLKQYYGQKNTDTQFTLKPIFTFYE